VRRWSVLAVALVATLGHARPPGTPDSGIVSIADGGPFTVIRGDDLRTGTRGVTLLAGDIIETGADAFLVIQTQAGTVIGIGASSEVYWLEHGAEIPLLVRKGWLKVDLRAAPKTDATRVAGPRAAVQCQQCVLLLHVDERSDSLYDEQGSGTLAGRPGAKEIGPGQFLVAREDDTSALQRPSAQFLAQMPVAFRDNLPAMPAGASIKPLEPEWVRKVRYADIQAWLLAQRSWRVGFVTRFRERLKDRTFFVAMDAHLDQLPEWVPVLHPKPPPEPPGNRPPPGTRPPLQ
jgi:hypothetical protein